MRTTLLLFCLLATPAGAQEAREWLQRMSQALGGLDYQGVLVYSHGGQLESMRVFHAVDADGSRERVVSLTGAPREIVRGGGQVICVGTSPTPTVYRGASLVPGVPPSTASERLAHYRVLLAGSDRIAGLDTQTVEVRAADGFRYSYRLWIERETGMLLKSMRFGADGMPLDQMMFVDIQLARRPDDGDLGLDSAVPEVAAQVALPKSAYGREPRWPLQGLPQGFVLVQLGRADDDGEHQVYSDGIANVSVYVHRLGAGTTTFSGPDQRGALQLFGRVLDGHQVTVVGDVPPVTAERFAQGVTMPASAGG